MSKTAAAEFPLLVPDHHTALADLGNGWNVVDIDQLEGQRLKLALEPMQQDPLQAIKIGRKQRTAAKCASTQRGTS